MNNRKINIVIPMAGAGARFSLAGYSDKPFIDIKGKTMIERVLEGIKYEGANYLLVIQQEFKSKYFNAIEKLKQLYNLEILMVKKLTQGASCTVLAAHEFINNPLPLIICDCDNIIDNNTFKKFINFSLNNLMDGSLITFNSLESCFSFVKTDEEGWVTDIREKKVISNNAIAGFYFIKQGKDFVNSAINNIIYGNKSKNEFYISNVYDDLIAVNKKIKIFEINKNEFNCVGTPDQLEKFLIKI